MKKVILAFCSRPKGEYLTECISLQASKISLERGFSIYASDNCQIYNKDLEVKYFPLEKHFSKFAKKIVESAIKDKVDEIHFISSSYCFVDRMNTLMNESIDQNHCMILVPKLVVGCNRE